jgi:hypothetical protein
MPQTQRIARLPIRLRGFVLPDTTSQFEGYVEPGDYHVLEEKPGTDSDYARLEVPTLGANDTWICTRWRTQKYAEILDVPAPPAAKRLSFQDEPLAVSEDRLVALLADFQDFRYDYDDGRYPWPLPGVKLPLAPPKTNNCCTFVEALTVKAFSEAHGAAFEWDARRHRQMMISSNEDYFSPVSAAVESGMAVAVLSHDAPPHPWTLIQGWRQQWRGGHTFLIVDHHAATDKVLILESNSAYGLDGVGYREIGTLRDKGIKPPAQWWTLPKVWTWRQVCSTYRFHEQAWLKVKDRKLSGLESGPSA